MSKTTKVGVAWKKTTPDGKEFLSVVITNPVGPDYRYTIWPVETKQGEKSPDYSVTKSSDASNAARTSTSSAFPAAQARPEDSPPGEYPTDDNPREGDDEVPF